MPFDGGDPDTENALNDEYPVAVMDAFAEGLDSQAGLTIISSSIYPYILTPNFSFNVWNAHYANPAGRWRDRTEFVELLEVEEDQTRFAALLMNNRYGQVDLLVLRRVDDHYVVPYLDDAFPFGLEPKEHRFPAVALDGSPYLSYEGIGGLHFFTPVYEENPLDEDACPAPCHLADDLMDSHGKHLHSGLDG